MSNRIKQLFSTTKAFTAYITVGDPNIEQSLEYAEALIKGGVNLLEIGVPFSDPIADGPEIQKAMLRAQDISITQVADYAERLREKIEIPLVLFSYFNPILKLIRNKEENIELCNQLFGSVDALLIVDLPVEESNQIHQICKEYDIDLIFIIAQSSNEHRIQEIHKNASGFLYYACQKGTTGIRHELPENLEEKLTMIKKNTTLPVIVGFGINNNQQVKKIKQICDGFVIGSYFVKQIANNIPTNNLTKLAIQINQ